MKLLLVAMLVAGTLAKKVVQAPAAMHIYGMKEGLKYVTELLEDSAVRMGLGMLQPAMCGITTDSSPEENNVLGETCHRAFAKLYEKQAPCGGGMCSLLNYTLGGNLTNLYDDFMRLKTDAQAFAFIKKRVFTPIMEHLCTCAVPIAKTWAGCVDNIGEAKIFEFITANEALNPFPLLDKPDAKQRLAEMTVITVLPWDKTAELVDRVMGHLCQNNEDKCNKTKCYSFLYDTSLSVLSWYQETMMCVMRNRMEDEKEKGTNRYKRSEDSYCSNTSCTNFKFAYDYNMSGDATKDNAVFMKKLCVPRCAPLYQEKLMGCCIASIVQDEDLPKAIQEIVEHFEEWKKSITNDKDLRADIKDLVSTMLGELGGGEDVNNAMEYTLEMLELIRNPTCKNSVKFNMTTCKERKASAEEEECMAEKEGNDGKGKGKGGKGKGGKGKGKGGKGKGKGGKGKGKGGKGKGKGKGGHGYRERE